MLKSGLLPSTWKLRVARACIAASCGVVTLLAPALGQDFTLQMQPFPSPAAIDPGGTTAAGITVSPQGTFSGTVDISCQVTSAATGQAVTSPVCDVSPQAVAPPANASVTITTTGATIPGLYTVTITATASGTTSSQSADQNLTVLAVVPQFTITVAEQVEPTSVHAGSGAQGTIDINSIYGYVIPTGGVTLSCSTITPLVTLPPQCTFTPNPVLPPATSSTLQITTTGPPPTAAVAHATPWFALWLPLPMLALAGVGAVSSGKRSRRACCLLALVVLTGTILLLPGCSSSQTVTTTNTNNEITPKGSYSFTISGVDANGVVSGNTGTSAATVSLTVD